MQKFIKTSLLLTLGLASAGAFAHGHGNMNKFHGFYGAIGVGALQSNAKIETDTASFFQTVNEPSNILGYEQSVRVWDTNVMGNFALGYGCMLNKRWHLGGEIFANVSKPRATLNNEFGEVSLTDDLAAAGLETDTIVKLNHWEYGADLLPGYRFDKRSLVRARIGFAVNKTKLESNNAFTFVDLATRDSTGTTVSTLNLEESKTRGALRLGLGIEHAICPKLSVTADYIYSHYGRLSDDGVADTTSVFSGTPETGDLVAGDAFVNTDGLVADASGRLQTHSLLVGLKYYFW